MLSNELLTLQSKEIDTLSVHVSADHILYNTLSHYFRLLHLVHANCVLACSHSPHSVVTEEQILKHPNVWLVCSTEYKMVGFLNTVSPACLGQVQPLEQKYLYMILDFITNSDNQVEEETGKCLQTLDPSFEVDRDEEEKWRATIALIWVSRKDNLQVNRGDTWRNSSYNFQ